MKTNVKMSGWEVGLRKIALSELLRSHAGLGLADAKRDVDSLLDGNELAFDFPDEGTARVFLNEATRLGAICAIEASVPGPGRDDAPRPLPSVPGVPGV